MALAMLSACAGETSSPAPLAHHGLSAETSMAAVTVREGDNLWQISKRYRLPLRDIIDINGLAPPYAISDGQRLKLPPPLEHKVAAHDTLHLISRMYAVSLSDLVKTNNLRAPYMLRAGQVVRIPSSHARQQQIVREEAIVQTARQAVAPVSSSVETEPLAPVKVAAATIDRAMPNVITTWAGEKGERTDGKKPQNTVLPPASLQPEKPQIVTTVQPAQRGGYVWPVRGKVISSYGPKEGGLYNDGINIAAPKGTPVAAAADGTVAYVGDDLRSYGNLVLIRHANGLTTAYAHLNGVSVRKGDRVVKGQSIGTVGSSGTVSNAQLHFEIRQSGKTVDPKQFLG